MSKSIATLKDLEDMGYTSPMAKDCLAGIVRKKILKGEELFPDIFGLDMEKRRFVEVLITGKGGLLTGEYGVAKTDLAKHVLSLLNEYYAEEQIFYVEKCPVQEDPMILMHSILNQNQNSGDAKGEPCPICKHLIREASGDLSQIGVRRLDQLVEGTGFARVQGGGDVLPEEIIGTYNLLKLAQIGDPFDPRVFEPGKIGQSSRGLLFVDEIGKLPETAQHALIQAAQESIVTPAKSRETFPVDFLLVATTNPLDEEYICGAVRDRLISLKIPMVGLEDEIRIVQKEIEKLEPRVYVPKVFLKLAVEVVRALRGDERLEIGPRTSINAGLVGRSSALLEGLSVAGFCNVKEGIYTAILGKALYEDKAGVEKRIDELFPEISSYIEKNIKEIDISKIVRYCHEEWGNDKEWDSTNIKKLINGKKAPANFVKLFRWTLKNESIDKDSIYEVISDYLLAYDRGCEISEKTN